MQLQKNLLIIIGIKQKHGAMIFNPSSQTKIMAGDILIAMGRIKDLDSLRELLLANKSGTGSRPCLGPISYRKTR